MAAPINFNLNDLSPGEHLWLWRRERGSTQADAARYFGVSVQLYRRVEKDQCRSKKIPPVSGAVGRPELLRLCRRRAGVGSRDVPGFGSHVTVLKLEAAGDADLAEFWTNYGFDVLYKERPCA